MSYTRGVPQPTDRIADTQGPIQTNFNLIDSDLGVDHYSPSSQSNNASPGTNIGYHYKVTLPALGSAATSPGAGKGVISSVTGSSQTYPYWLRDAVSTTAYPVAPVRAMGDIGISGSSLTFVNSFNINTGTSVKTGVGAYTINFNTAMKGASYLVFVTPQVASASTKLTTAFNAISSTQVQIYINSASGGATDPVTFSLLIMEY